MKEQGSSLHLRALRLGDRASGPLLSVGNPRVLSPFLNLQKEAFLAWSFSRGSKQCETEVVNLPYSAVSLSPPPPPFWPEEEEDDLDLVRDALVKKE